MIKSLLRKRYAIPLVSFLFFSFLSGGFLHGAPPGMTRPPVRVGNRLYFTPACPIIAQNFNTAADVNGATQDTSSVGWYLDASKVPNATYFAIKSHRLKAQTLKGEGVWYSRVFSIAGYTGIQVDAKISSEGTLSSAEYMKVSYILDGGPETLIEKVTGSFGNDSTPTVTSAPMTGSTVQIVVRMYDTTAGNSEFYIENYDVFKEVGPCMVTSGITVSASASNSGILTCAHPSTTLTASTTASGTTTYSWTGPNSFTATGASVTATAAGTYTVTGTNAAGTGTATVTVTGNTTPPAGVAITAANNVTQLTCSTNFTTLSGSSTTSGVTYSWSGPNNFTATTSAVNVFNAGTYTMTVTNPTSGCTASTSIAITENVTPPAGVVVAPAVATLTCSTPNATLTGSSTTSGVSYAWTGPSSFTATGTTATAVTPGEYILTVTDPANGCTTSTAATITANFAPPAGVTAINNGPITCSNSSVTLTGNSSTANVSYSWTGPNNYAASTATATTTAPGSYTLTVTNPVNGCTATATTVVAQDIAAPTDVTVSSSTPSPVLNCTNTSLTLTASSSTPGVTYAWRIGPTGSTVLGTAASLTVSQPNAYDVLVTNPANGCAFLSGQTVTQNITPPASVNVTTIPANAVLTCSNTSVALTGTSSDAAATYAWTGPNGFTASAASASTGTAGVYTLTATDPTNGCTSTASTTVTQNTTAPNPMALSTNTGTTTINCTNPTLTLTGSTSTADVNYSWTGPGGFSALTSTTTITTPGTYTETATSTDNGCSTTAATTIAVDTATPTAVSTSSVPANAMLTCSSPNVVLTGTSGTAGVTYAWTGPNGFAVSAAVATATTPGSYVLTVTNPVNGCSTAVTATAVTQNVVVPVGVTANASNKITCTTTTTTLTGNSTTSGATFAWAGPGGFASTARVATASLGGVYTLTAINPANGCTASKTVTVVADTAAPAGVTATNSGQLNCDVATVTLTGNSTTAGVTYIWTGPDGYFDPEQISSMATDSGAYVLTVTNPENGCTTQATTVVTEDLSACSAIGPKQTAGQASGFDDSTTLAGFTYKVYPNPVSNTTVTIAFQTPVTAQVIVEIYSNTGAPERVLFSHTAAANQAYRLTLNPGGLAAGIHYCQISVNGKVYTTKLLLLAN